MTAVAVGNYLQYRVPKENGTALVYPPVPALLAELKHPNGDISDCGLEFCGKRLDVARAQAREEVIRKAVEFTSAYRDLPARNWSQAQNSAIVMAGHQPELFHAGVWFKNFLLSRLATESEAIAINFLVDNDLCRSSSIRVPAHDADGLLVAKSVLFDQPRDTIPWELRRLESHACWQHFPAAVQQALLPLAGEPLLDELWRDATAAVKSTDRLGLAIAQARHKLEQRLGLQTLEIPLSHLVSTRAFARFSIQLLSELPRFQDDYNSQLHAYRIAHRIRSHAHPVPALEQEQGWLEAPWWIYRSEAPKRQRMWVRLLDNQLMLSDRAGWQATIEGRLDCDGAASQWLDLLADGICLRPRALLTTMYLRIMVSDLFIHGIGGGKYDQLTDGIVRQFFGIPTPPMAVVTATLNLPFRLPTNEPVGAAQVEAARIGEREKLWQLKYHADQFLKDISPEAKELAKRKQELLVNIPPRGEKWQWHREITAVNRQLSRLMGVQVAQAKQRLETLASQDRQQRVFRSREYSFCLFPRAAIAAELTRMAAQ